MLHVFLMLSNLTRLLFQSEPFHRLSLLILLEPCVLLHRIHLPFCEVVSRVLRNVSDHLLGVFLHFLIPEQEQIWMVLTLPAWWENVKAELHV